MDEEKEKPEESWSESAKNLGVDKIVPEIYQDGLKSAVQEVGKGLTTLGEAINCALLPVRGVVWSFKQIESVIKEKLSRKLAGVLPKDIIEPPIIIAGPTIEALRFSGDEPLLQDMFASLLASSMTKNSIHNVHPAFVEVIKQMSGDEAHIINLITKMGTEVINRNYALSQAVTNAGTGESVYSNQSKDGVHFQIIGLERSFYLPEIIISARHSPSILAFDILYHKFSIKLREQQEKLNSQENIGFSVSKRNLSNLMRLEIFSIQTSSSKDPFDENGKYDISIVESRLFLTEFGRSFLSSCV